MAAPEKKKRFKNEVACTGKNCPIRFGCRLYFNMNDRNNSREVIRPPFTTVDGVFKSCNQYRNL